MSNLVEFLRALGSDAEVAGEFKRDKRVVMQKYGLTDEEQQAVLTHDNETVKRLSGFTDVQMTNSTIKAYE